MLIEFSVSNFKSIKDEARLSLVANAAEEHRSTHLITPQTGSARATPLLCSAVLYGANAAGKTNLIRALELMGQFVLASKDNNYCPYVVPFKFDPSYKMRPTTFEVTCIADGIRYQYGFSVTQGAVTNEWLYAWPHGRIQVWFERDHDDWKLGSKLAGDKEIWRRATRRDALFLSTAISLNGAQLRSIFDWFSKTLDILHTNHLDYTSMMQSLQDGDNADIIQFLRSADLAISDLRMAEMDWPPVGMSSRQIIENLRFTTLPADQPKDSHEVKILKLWLSHDIGNNEAAELEFAEESEGTRQIFSLAGPWLKALKNGRVLIVDELHEHLHPGLVRFLVDQFHNPRVNQHGAQLVFSTHDTSILTQDVFRRDQIWFCERNDRQETRLFPLTDFHPRKGLENLERAYLTGRYGALPYVQPQIYSFET